MTPSQPFGNFFEDFELGQLIRHGTPRTVSDGDASVYTALTGSRSPAASADTTARLCGFPHRPLDDWLVFNVAFGKTVRDISQNAVANLGYADVRFLQPVFAGATLRCESLVIGMREVGNGKSGIVHVRSTCFNEDDVPVLSWVRWVMVRKRMEDRWTGRPGIPDLLASVPAVSIESAAGFATPQALANWCRATASEKLWDDYAVGDRIHHPAGMTIEEADHMSATRLYQNNAQVHFVAATISDGQVKRRLVYGGHVISVCQALAYDGLDNGVHVAAINGGRHVAPVFAGDVLTAVSTVLDCQAVQDRTDIGLLRIRLSGLRNVTTTEVVALDPSEHPSLVLELDYWLVMPRRQ